MVLGLSREWNLVFYGVDFIRLKHFRMLPIIDEKSTWLQTVSRFIISLSSQWQQKLLERRLFSLTAFKCEVIRALFCNLALLFAFRWSWEKSLGSILIKMLLKLRSKPNTTESDRFLWLVKPETTITSTVQLWSDFTTEEINWT